MEIVRAQEIRRKLHRVFRGMHERCEYPKHKRYAYYGGRGIAVSDEWGEFEPFYEWALAKGYKPGLTLDRENNDLGYSPGNCRWITRKAQMSNTRRVKLVDFRGESRNPNDLSGDSAAVVSGATIRRRLNKGMPSEDAVTMPNIARHYIAAFGETKSVKEWSGDARCQVCYGTLFDRIIHGWDAEKAISTPKKSHTDARNGQTFTAFGETKTMAQWAKDPRCVVQKSSLSMRLYKYGYSPERALTEPSKRWSGSVPRVA